MPLCARCQREAPEGALYCPYCSAPVLPPQGDGAAPDPLVGQTIRDTYLVQERIGGGGMGEVYRAIQINLDRPVALKLLRPHFHSDPTIVQRFHREARASSRLHHPNIIAVLDFGQAENGTLFMAMEYLPGRNLLKLMQDEFPLGEGRVVHIATQILSALTEAHGAGIVHRDLKPENVMVESRRDEPDVVKVLDFGIAQIQEPGEGRRLTQTGVVFGTPDYMSPEQAAQLPLDARSDLYSVGVMLYEMLTGRHPFQAATPPAMAQAQVVQAPPPMAERCPPGLEVSPALEALVMRALAKSPDDRFQAAGEMRRELLDCSLDPGLVEAHSPGTPAATPTRPLGSPPSIPQRMTPRPQTPRTPPARSGPAERTPSGRRPVPLTEVIPRSVTPSPQPPVETPAPTGGARPRSRLLFVLGLLAGSAVLAGAGILLGRSIGQKQPPPTTSLEAVRSEEKAPPPVLAPEPKALEAPAAAAQPTPATASPAQEPPKPPAVAAAEPEPAAKPAPPRGQKGKRLAAVPAPQRPAASRAAAKKSPEASPPRAAAPAPVQPALAPPPVASTRREAFVTREVVGFQQFMGDPELKGRGRGLVDRARWLLEPSGMLTFAPVEKAPGFFPMTVHATREGNRVWFEGVRTAGASDGPAYVRISGNLAVSAEPMLTVDLEFGRASGADAAELEPTYRARARLRLASE